MYGLDTQTERYLLISYLLIVLISALVGDTAILIGSQKYQAFKNLHSLIVLFIQHIAVCDLVLSLTFVAPIILNILADGPLLDDGLCNLYVYVYHYFLYVNLVFVAAMTTTKAVFLRYPRCAQDWSAHSTWRKHAVCVGLWIYSAYYPATLLAVDRKDLMFDYRTYSWDYGFTSPTWKWLQPVNSILVGLIPITTVAIATVPSVRVFLRARRVSKRVRGIVRWQGLVTVLATATVFCICFLPYTVYSLAEHFVQESTPGPFRTFFYRIAFFITAVNIMANFYIYSLTVRGFNEFLRFRIHLLAYYLKLANPPLTPSKFLSNTDVCLFHKRFHVRSSDEKTKSEICQIYFSPYSCIYCTLEIYR